MNIFETMSNYELGTIAKAFDECGSHNKCADCPCEGKICGRDDFGYMRELFNREIAKRLLESK